jgi:amidase
VRRVPATDLAGLDAIATAELIRSGEVHPLEAVEAAIARIETLNPRLNAVVYRRFEQARSEARHAGDGPFRGVPMLVKDLGCETAGDLYGAGSRGVHGVRHRSPADSALATRLRRAGFVILGRTNTPEFGSTITTEPLATGACRNPWNVSHSPGGSSGGSAAAVASGMVPVAEASDGGGSIRIPASACGLVGLKPGRGRLSFAPGAGESWAGFVTEGAVTRSVRDAAAMLDVMAGYESGDPYTAPPTAESFRSQLAQHPGRLRVGVLDHPLLEGSDGHPEVTAAVRDAAGLLERLGHEVVEGYPAALADPETGRRFLTIVAVWTALDVASWERVAGRPFGEDDLEADNLALAEIGRGVSGPAYVEAVSWLQGWSRRVTAWWAGTDGMDVLLTPVIAKPPPPLGTIVDGPSLRQYFQYTAWFNITGQPAVSLPLGMSSDTLPIGVQLVAAPWREDLLVRLAAQVEQAAPWASRRPAVRA